MCLRWVAILVLVVLPMLSAFTATILQSIWNPSSMLWEGFQIRMWLYLILPSASAISYAASRRGHPLLPIEAGAVAQRRLTEQGWMAPEH